MYYRMQNKMPQELISLYDGMLAELEQCQLEATNPLMAAGRCVSLLEGILGKLRVWVEDHGFKSEEEEIVFFKHIKPSFHCQLLYQQELGTLELGRPRGSRERVRQYFN